MGLMTKILETEKVLSAKILQPAKAAAILDDHPPEGPADSAAAAVGSPPVGAARSPPHHEPSPCPACGSPGFWHSVYGGDLKCLTCEPPPGRSLVRRKFFLAADPVDPHNPGGPWRRVLEPWEWHFGDLNRGSSGEEFTTIVDDTGLEDPRTVGRIAWQYDRAGNFVGAKFGLSQVCSHQTKGQKL